MRPFVRSFVSLVLALAGLVALSGCAPKSGSQNASQKTGTEGSSDITTAYRAWAIAECNDLVGSTRVFVDALAAGDIARAKTLYPTTRMPYERIEPIAEALGSLDPDIDGRDGDVPADQWRGFHRIERALWTGQERASINDYGKRLLEDVTLLRAKLDGVEITVPALALGAVELLNEVATSKITGEEERYSHTDLYDFAANVEGARKIFDMLEPTVRRRDAELATRTTESFQKLDTELGKYRRGSGYALYTELSSTETRALAQAVDALADPLAKVAALVGATK